MFGTSRNSQSYGDRSIMNRITRIPDHNLLESLNRNDRNLRTNHLHKVLGHTPDSLPSLDHTLQPDTDTTVEDVPLTPMTTFRDSLTTDGAPVTKDK